METTPTGVMPTQGTATTTREQRAPARRSTRDDRIVQIELEKWMKLAGKMETETKLDTDLESTKESLNQEVLKNLRDLKKELDATDWMYEKRF